MKIIAISSLFLCTAAVVASATEFVNVLRQTQLDTGVESYVTIDSETIEISQAPIPAAGSKFELWAIHQTTGEEYLIDMQYVSAFFAGSAITIGTGDPHEVTRTRIDQDIEVTIEVYGLSTTVLTHADLGLDGEADSDGGNGGTAVVDASLIGDGTSVIVTSTKDLSNVVLLFADGAKQKIEGLIGYVGIFSGSGANARKEIVGVWIKSGDNSSGDGPGYGEFVDPTYNPDPDYNTGNNIDAFVAPIDPSKVLLIQKSYSYPEDSNSVVGGTLNDQVLSTTAIDRNGQTKLTIPAASLPAGDTGEVVLTVAALAGQDITETILDSARVQVWPIATGTISGVDPAIVYENLPPVTLTLDDLYPASTTYLRIYPGPPSDNPGDAQKVSDSVVILDEAVPHDRSMILRELDEMFTTHGTHTLEVVHETPFGEDVLARETVQIDRLVEIKGALFTTE